MEAIAPGSTTHGAALVGVSSSHVEVLQKLEKVAPTDAEVLITGPSGVGKELFARHVHTRSRRRNKSFVAVNCGAIPSALFENEFFGHAAGAYTGAKSGMFGLLTEAEGGTLFLDEVDALPLHDQVKLLRVIQEREYRRLGESRVRKADVRIVSGTNANLQAAIQSGSFRQDLFFRLRVVPIEIAPLAERPDDIEPLLEHFTPRYAEEYQVSPIRLSRATRTRLCSYAWPGNVRELENCVRYLTCLQLERDIQPADLPLAEASDDQEEELPAILDASFQIAKSQIVDVFERTYLERVLRKAKGNIGDAARRSGKHRRAFFELLKKHEIDAKTYRA